MRVTNNMMVNNLLSNINKNMIKVDKYQQSMSTGKKYLTPSDEPVEVSKIMKYKTDLDELEQYKRNTSDALSWMDTTESTLNDITEATQRLNELVVKGATGTNSSLDSKIISDEVQQLKQVIITNGNFSFAGKYIYSSFKSNEPLFKDDGTYNIDITDFETNNKPVSIYEIGIGEQIEIGVNGLDVFGYKIENDGLLRNISNNISDSFISSGSISEKEYGVFEFQMNQNYNNLSISVNGTNYTLPGSGLNGSTKPLNKDILIKGLKEASDGLGGFLGNNIDIYYDQNNKLVLKNKNFGNITDINISHPGINQLTYKQGLPTVEANISTLTPMTPSDFTGNPYDNKSYYFTINGKSEKITLGSGINNVLDLKNMFQTKLDDSFGNGKVLVNESGGNLSFSTIGTSDGIKPEIEIKAITVKKSEIMTDLDTFINDLQMNDKNGIKDFITKLTNFTNRLLSVRSEIGAKTNRLDLVSNRIEDNVVTTTTLLSNSQDVDIAEIVMKLKNAQAVYESSLSVGSKVIQKTLVDFLL